MLGTFPIHPEFCVHYRPLTECDGGKNLHADDAPELRQKPLCAPAFGEDEQGELYVVDYAGKILKIVLN